MSTVKNLLIVTAVLILVSGTYAGFRLSLPGSQPIEAPVQKGRITIRTENFPRPPYSGATYYIYERDDEVICTKLQVCNKYDDCTFTYKKGSYKDEEDIRIGDPYRSTKPVVIAPKKLKKHVCLTKFKLLP